VSWIPDDPTQLPEALVVARPASALWWPELLVVRVSSRTLARPASLRALEAAVRAAGVYPGACRWLCEDAPYVVPPLAVNWARVASTNAGGRQKIWWALCSFRPQMRINDKAWTWRRAWVAGERRVGTVIGAEMEAEARAWAAGNGCAYLSHVATARPLEPGDMDIVRAARGATCV
jgi:hypothetical protein